mgnify:CR=1 FL=1
MQKLYPYTSWQERFIEKSKVKHHNKYDYSNVCYVKSNTKVEITCPHHGTFFQRPNDHLRGDGCPHCKIEHIADAKRSDVDTFIKKAQNLHQTKYDYTKVKYVNANTKVKIVCKKHGEFFQTPDKHLHGTGCPKCSNGISRGEQTIQNFLEENEIEYEREKRFNDLRGSTPNSRLRYDFFVPSHNMFIEYDGEHHYLPVQTKGRISKDEALFNHNATKTNDEKKDEYAKEHKYTIIRISFKDREKINSILEEIFHPPST